MSEQQYKAHQAKHGFIKGGDASCSPTYKEGSSAAQTFKPKRAAKTPNKTESEFYRILCCKHNQYPRFEAVKLRIGGNCYYSPDWMLIFNGRPTFYECKGGWKWEDSIIKFKAAKELHGEWADFEMHQKKQGAWSRIL